MRPARRCCRSSPATPARPARIPAVLATGPVANREHVQVRVRTQRHRRPGRLPDGHRTRYPDGDQPVRRLPQTCQGRPQAELAAAERALPQLLNGDGTPKQKNAALPGAHQRIPARPHRAGRRQGRTGAHPGQDRRDRPGPGRETSPPPPGPPRPADGAAVARVQRRSVARRALEHLPERLFSTETSTAPSPATCFTSADRSRTAITGITVTLDRPDTPPVARALHLLTDELNATPVATARRPPPNHLPGHALCLNLNSQPDPIFWRSEPAIARAAFHNQPHGPKSPRAANRASAHSGIWGRPERVTSSVRHVRMLGHVSRGQCRTVCSCGAQHRTRVLNSTTRGTVTGHPRHDRKGPPDGHEARAGSRARCRRQPGQGLLQGSSRLHRGRRRATGGWRARRAADTTRFGVLDRHGHRLAGLRGHDSGSVRGFHLVVGDIEQVARNSSAAVSRSVRSRTWVEASSTPGSAHRRQHPDIAGNGLAHGRRLLDRASRSTERQRPSRHSRPLPNMARRPRAWATRPAARRKPTSASRSVGGRRVPLRRRLAGTIKRDAYASRLRSVTTVLRRHASRG